MAASITFKQFVEGPTGIIATLSNVVIPVLFALAFIALMWGILQYFFINVADEQSRQKGKDFVIWGILGMVLLVSAWGVVYILLNTLGLSV